MSDHGHEAGGPPPIYGAMAEFDTPEAVLAAAHSAYSQGFRKMDAYTPVPVEGLEDAIGFKKNAVRVLVFVCGVAGLFTAFGLQVYASVINYPLNIGGRPYFSWPSFMPIMFELTVLFASLGAVFGMLILNGLPLLYHPVFNAPRFLAASQTAYFLCIEAADPLFDAEETTKFLRGLAPLDVTLVEK